MEKTATKKIAYTGVFLALVMCFTLISIPIPGTAEYINLGDTVIFFGAYLLGFPYALIASIGACFADLILGYAIYAPATLIIKPIMCIIACVFVRKTYLSIWKNALMQTVGYILGSVFMQGGYILFNYFIFGTVVTGISMFFVFLQSIICVPLAVILYFATLKIKVFEKIRLEMKEKSRKG